VYITLLHGRCTSNI